MILKSYIQSPMKKCLEVAVYLYTQMYYYAPSTPNPSKCAQLFFLVVVDVVDVLLSNIFHDNNGLLARSICILIEWNWNKLNRIEIENKVKKITTQIKIMKNVFEVCVLKRSISTDSFRWKLKNFFCHFDRLQFVINDS